MVYKMNIEEIKEIIDNCLDTECSEQATNDILFSCRFDDIPKVIEFLIDKLKNK